MRCTCTFFAIQVSKGFVHAPCSSVSDSRLTEPEIASRKVEIVINHIQLLGVQLTSENSFMAEMRRKRCTDVMVIATVASQDTVSLVIRIPF